MSGRWRDQDRERERERYRDYVGEKEKASEKDTKS